MSGVDPAGRDPAIGHTPPMGTVPPASTVPPPGGPAHAQPRVDIDPAVAAADTEAERRAASQSLGDIVGELTGDLSRLMRQELELAKAEAKQQASRAGKGAGMLGGAGYAAMLVVLFLSLALMWALGDWLDHPGWGALTVAVLWAIVAAVLYVTGRKALKEVEPMPETVDSVKHIPDALHTKEESR